LEPLTFQEILTITKGFSEFHGANFSVSGFETDTRRDVLGKAFVALNDGAKYLRSAEKKGALLAVISAYSDVEAGVILPLIRVENTLDAFQEIAAFWRGRFDIPLVALTGSNGKTTTKDMLTAILSAKYKTLATENNYNNHIGVPKTLLKLNNSYEAAVLELGMNHSGEIRSLAKIVKPTIAVITKIGSAHIGEVGSEEEIFKAKMEITEGLINHSLLIVSEPDDKLSRLNSTEKYEVIRGKLRASDIKQYWTDAIPGISFVIHEGENKYPCELPVFGAHNVNNALLALTVGVILGIPLPEAIEELRSYTRSSMRLETAVLHNVKYIKDYYNSSPDSVKAALDTLSAFETDGRKIAILGEVTELGAYSAELHREIAEYSIGKADIVYFIGEDYNSFKSGRPDSKVADYCGKKDELFAMIKDAISENDIVLINGSNGMKMGEVFEFLRKRTESAAPGAPPQTTLRVDVAALKHNYGEIKRYVGKNVEIMPVIKADGYGSSADIAASAFAGAKYFAVADLQEADKISHAIPNTKILIIYQPLPFEIDAIAEREYLVSVGDADFLTALNLAAKKRRKIINIHIEVDTGMSRLGVLAKDCAAFAKVLRGCENIAVDGIFTHYSSADMYSPEDLEFTALQTAVFKRAIVEIEEILGREIPHKHACAGAAIFNPEAEIFNMVRPGYILYGYYPCEEIKEFISLKPALKLVTAISQIKEYPAGTNISYGRSFTASKTIRAAIVPIGYSDGIYRSLSNTGAFVVNGLLAPIIGKICMDYTIIDVTDISPEAKVGDEVAIFDNVNMTVERIAELCGTIGYEIISKLRDKADRIEVY
jgi:alanine racemase